MKEKIKARIRAMFPDVNLSDQRMEVIASRLEKKVADENQMDDQINAVNDITPFSEIAATDDKVRDLKGKLRIVAKPQTTAVETEKTTTVQTGSTEKKDDKDDDPPAWAKGLLESNKKLSDKLEAYEKKDKQQTLREKILKDDRLKEIKPSFWKKWVLPENDDDVDAFVESIVSEYQDFTAEDPAVSEEAGDKTEVNGFKPKVGSKVNLGGDKTKVSSMMQGYLKQKEAVNKTTV